MASSVLLFTSAVLIVFLGFTVLLSRPKKFLNQTFFLFCLTAAGWIFSIFILLNFSQTIIWGQLPFIFSSLSAAFLLLFSCALGVRSPKHKALLALLLIPAVIVSLFSLGGEIIKSVVVNDNFVINTFGGLYSVFVIYLAFYLLTILSVLIYKYKTNSGNERMKIRYVFLGIFSFVVPSVLTNMLLPTFLNFWQLNSIGPAFSLFMVSAISYSILRYHLMDVWVLVRLGTIFTLLLGVISFFFVSFNYLLVYYLHIGSPWNSILPSFFITIGFIPLKRLIELATDKIFFRKHYKLSDLIGNIEASIHASGLDLNSSLESVNQIVANALKLEKAVILILIPRDHFASRQIIGTDIASLELKHNNPVITYLNSFSGSFLDREEVERNPGFKGLSDSARQELVAQLDKIGFSLVVPIEFKGKLVGVYLLGAKKSGDSFNKDDIKLLQHAAWEMSSAIDNAKSFEELKRLDEAKSNFISVVSHQLRTPVTISRCNLELALDDGLTAEEKNTTMKAAYEGVSSLGHQLDQLLTVLEIEEKEMVVKKEQIDINKMISNLLLDNKIIIKNKRLRLEFSPDKIKTDGLFGDKDKIRRVLDILLINAVNYTPAGGKVAISLALSNFNSKSSLVVSVSDNGVSISESDKASIFKKFFRSAEATSMSPNGFGLGLFIARKIIKAHGGDIWFESQENKGTIFYFSLPIKK